MAKFPCQTQYKTKCWKDCFEDCDWLTRDVSELLSSAQTCLILVFARFLPFFLSNFSNKVSSSESWHLLYNFSSYKFCCVTFVENENKFWCQVQSRGTTYSGNFYFINFLFLFTFVLCKKQVGEMKVIQDTERVQTESLQLYKIKFVRQTV